MLTPLTQHSTEALANAIRREKKRKGTRTGKEETKLPCVETTRKCTQRVPRNLQAVPSKQCVFGGSQDTR